jgi:nucleotide-binding universal stress UspA family protein
MFRHLLVALDGTRRSEIAIPCALELAKLASADLTLVRAIAPSGTRRVSLGERGSLGRRDPSADVYAAAVREAEKYLAAQAEHVRAYGVDVRCTVRVGEPATEIIAAATQHGADTIVIATGARRGVDRLMMGSVAERVVQSTSMPVILLRAAWPGL